MQTQGDGQLFDSVEDVLQSVQMELDFGETPADPPPTKGAEPKGAVGTDGSVLVGVTHRVLRSAAERKEPARFDQSAEAQWSSSEMERLGSRHAKVREHSYDELRAENERLHRQAWY